MLKVCVCPEADDVPLDIPAEGGVSTSALASVIVCVWPESREDVNVRDVVGVGVPPPPPEGELESEQPYAASRGMLATAISNLNRFTIVALSFRSTAAPSISGAGRRFPLHPIL